MRAEADERVAIPLARVPPGTAVPVDAFGTTIAVFNVHGRLFALENRCLHHGGPLCHGRVRGTQLPSEPGGYRYDPERPTLVCPWHGWEYDLESGRAQFKRSVRLRTFAVREEGDEVALYRRRP